MSTNTTSRESTWTPRYAWMPVSTRHMRNGAHRIAKSSAIISFEYLRERLEIVVDRRDVVVGALDRTHRIGHDERLGAAADRLHQLGPAIHFPIELLQERLAVFLEHGTVVRSQAREPVDDVLRDDG